ncbi:MAG: hypothetical protein AAF219_10015 [Myxococcota bacterium]
MKRLHRRSEQVVILKETTAEVRCGKRTRVFVYDKLKAPWLIRFPWCLLLRRRTGWPVALLGRNELRDLAGALSRRLDP